MGIGADDNLSRGCQALFRHQGVFHAHLSHVVEVGDVEALGKSPGLSAELGRLDVLAGGIVVQNDGDLVLVKDLSQPCLVKLGDGHRRGDVIAQHQVQPGLNELARLDGVQARVLGQNLLGHGHSHGWVPPCANRCTQYARALVKRM